jgi:hypothetical protein
MKMRNDVKIVPDFFDPEDAENLIEYMDHLEEEGLMQDRGDGRIGVVDLENRYTIQFIDKYRDKIAAYFNDGFNKVSGSIMTIYREGVGMNMHSDSQPFPEMGALFYLNDDYEGGELAVGDDFIYKPKKYDLVYMSSEPMHGVLPVTKGTRYFFTISLVKS